MKHIHTHCALRILPSWGRLEFVVVLSLTLSILLFSRSLVRRHTTQSRCCIATQQSTHDNLSVCTVGPRFIQKAIDCSLRLKPPPPHSPHRNTKQCVEMLNKSIWLRQRGRERERGIEQQRIERELWTSTFCRSRSTKIKRNPKRKWHIENALHTIHILNSRRTHILASRWFFFVSASPLLVCVSHRFSSFVLRLFCCCCCGCSSHAETATIWLKKRKGVYEPGSPVNDQRVKCTVCRQKRDWELMLTQKSNNNNRKRLQRAVKSWYFFFVSSFVLSIRILPYFGLWFGWIKIGVQLVLERSTIYRHSNSANRTNIEILFYFFSLSICWIKFVQRFSFIVSGFFLQFFFFVFFDRKLLNEYCIVMQSEWRCVVAKRNF